jgi:hypothetical protein
MQAKMTAALAVCGIGIALVAFAGGRVVSNQMPQATPVIQVVESASVPMEEMINAIAQRQFFDPQSAQFTNLTPVTTPQGKPFMCGLVNLKNRVGGYTGQNPFTYSIEGNMIWIVQNTTEIANLLALRLAGCDKILGVE